MSSKVGAKERGAPPPPIFWAVGKVEHVCRQKWTRKINDLEYTYQIKTEATWAGVECDDGYHVLNITEECELLYIRDRFREQKCCPIWIGLANIIQVKT